MRGIRTRISLLVVFSLVLTLMLAGTALAAKKPKPGLQQMGATVLRYYGPEVTVMLSYRFASNNLKSEWIVLDMSVTGNLRVSTEVKRDKIRLQLPNGEFVALPSQKEFNDAYAQLASINARADIGSEPLNYFAPREQCDLPFFSRPGNISLDSVWVNDQRACFGRLYFPLVDVVQPGRYELQIDFPETKVRIPFELGSRKSD